jgi:hypothetical protein
MHGNLQSHLPSDDMYLVLLPRVLTPEPEVQMSSEKCPQVYNLSNSRNIHEVNKLPAVRFRDCILSCVGKPEQVMKSGQMSTEENMCCS